MQRGFAALFLLAMAQAPQAAPFAYVLVASQVGHVAEFDTASNKLVTLIPSGGSPVGVAANSSGTRLYVSNSDGTVAAIDTTTNEVITTVHLRHRRQRDLIFRLQLSLKTF
jgi:YVTN family beta-propeller protein